MCAVISTAVFGFYKRHDPTPAEQKALTKYTDTMNKLLDQFRSPDWDEKIDATIDHPTVDTFGDRPMDIDQLLKRTYEVRKDSKRYKTLIEPRLQKKRSKRSSLRRPKLKTCNISRCRSTSTCWLFP